MYEKTKYEKLTFGNLFHTILIDERKKNLIVVYQIEPRDSIIVSGVNVTAIL